VKEINFNITVIRHASTEYGEEQRFMGTLDVPCSEKGKLDAKQASVHFRGKKYFRLYCSPLTRAKETCELLFPNQNPIIEPNLTERGLGEWAGKDRTTIKLLFPEAFYDSGVINPFYTPKDGETIESVIYRVKNFIDLLTDLYNALKSDSKKCAEYNIAIITHNGIIRVLRSLMEDFPMSEIFNKEEPNLKSISYNFNKSKWERISN